MPIRQSAREEIDYDLAVDGRRLLPEDGATQRYKERAMSRIEMENQSRGSAPAMTSATTVSSGRPTRIVDGGGPSGPR